MTIPPLIKSLHTLSIYLAAGIASFGWALSALVGWDADPWLPYWFFGALLAYNADRLRHDPADGLNLPERTAAVERLRPMCAGLALVAAAILLVLPLLHRDWMTFALVIVGAFGCLSYSIPTFGMRFKDVPLLKTLFAPTVLLCAFVIPPFLREGGPERLATAFIAFALSGRFRRTVAMWASMERVRVSRFI